MIPLDIITSIHTMLASLIALITMDTINGAFELSAGFFVLNHCRVLHADKAVRGISLLSVAFFTLWGAWNPFYYSALQQPMSFYGGLFVVLANVIYLAMLYAYRTQPLPIDEHAIYLGVESHAFPRNGDQ